MHAFAGLQLQLLCASLQMLFAHQGMTLCI